MEYEVRVLWEVRKYINDLPEDHRQKIEDIFVLLEQSRGVLEYPYSSHLRGKIRELRIGIGKFNHRILYALASDRQILLLTAFLKKTKKTPQNMIDRAERIFKLYLEINKK